MRSSPVEASPNPPPPGLTLVQGVMEEGWRLDGEMARPDRSDAGEGDHAPGGLWFLTDAELFGWGKPKPRRPQRTACRCARGLLRRRQARRLRRAHRARHRPVPGARSRWPWTASSASTCRSSTPRATSSTCRSTRPTGWRATWASGEAAPGAAPAGHRRVGAGQGARQKAVAEIADDLLELYAAREVVQGHAFSPDAPWQHELEASFPYVETEDQLVAIEAVKHDMEQPRPMDRLICGDVGYGKTEVALARGVQGDHGRQAGRRAGADHRPGAAALHQLQPPAGRVPGHRGHALALPDARRSRIAFWRAWRTAASTW